MTTQHSFTKVENNLLPRFRKMIGSAESTEDVKKFYVYIMQDLFHQVFSGNITLNFEDIMLAPDSSPPYLVAEHLLSQEKFNDTWNTSDLSHVVARFTETAINRFKHLEKNPGKTESKIRK